VDCRIFLLDRKVSGCAEWFLGKSSLTNFTEPLFCVTSLQSYSVGGWDYMTELHKFVDGGMQGNEFIDAASGIVNRGCHNPPCATGDVDGKSDRRDNFYKVLNTLQVLPATEATNKGNYIKDIKSIAIAVEGEAKSTGMGSLAVKY